MSNDFPRKRKFTALIDLTTRGQEVAKAEVAQRELAAASAATAPGPDAAPEADFTLAEAPEIIRKAAVSAGWDRLMPVQEKTIPGMLAGRDLIVQSKTGSGKTGAFLLPFFASLDPAENAPQALVMTPTRELARQIYDEFLRLGGPALGFRAALVYGGVAYGPQQDALRGTSKEGPAHVVIGTPGRILDHLERRTFSLDRLKTLVLDEADEMLSMGFLPAMRKLHRYLPAPRQSTMFSATMPPSVRALAGQFLYEPQFLALSGGSVQIDALSHRYYAVDPMEKDRALIRIIEMENPESAIIFANTKREVEYLAQFLRNYGHDAGEISGDLNQSAREAMMARIRAGNLRFLVATDVAARGIDISDLSHVVQYDVPVDPEYYVHRAGRTARAGKTGVAITFVAPHDKPKLLSIFRRYDLSFEEREVPTEEEVAERVRERLTVLLEDRYRDLRPLARERIARFEPLVRALADEEPQLLAMLLDALYHESLHRAPQAEIIETSTHRGLAPLPREERSRGRDRRKGRAHDDAPRELDADASTATPEDPAPAEPAPARAAEARAPRTPAEESPAPEAAPAPEETPAVKEVPSSETTASETTEDRERRRRKRRRKRKSGAGPLEPETDASGEADDAPASPATTADVPAPEAETPPADDDERRSDRARRSRGGRNRRSERTEDASLPPSPPARETPRPAPTPEAAEAPTPATAPAPRKAPVPPGPYRIHELRTLPEGTLRAIGEVMEVGESATMGRDDLLYRILEVQAERESTGRGRRPGARPVTRGKEAPKGKPAPGGRAAPAKPAPEARPATAAKPSATTPETTAESAAAKPARRSRGRGRTSAERPRETPAEAPLADTPANAATPSEAPVSTAPASEAPAETPRRRSNRRTSAAEPTPAAPVAEAPLPATPEEVPAEKPRRRTRKPSETAEAPPETAPEVPAAKPARRTRKAAPVEAAPDETPAEAPKRRTRKTAPPAEATAASASEPAAEASAPKPRARRKKADTDAATLAAAPTDTPAPEAAPKPRRRTKKADAPPSDEA